MKEQLGLDYFYYLFSIKTVTNRACCRPERIVNRELRAQKVIDRSFIVVWYRDMQLLAIDRL